MSIESITSSIDKVPNLEQRVAVKAEPVKKVEIVAKQPISLPAAAKIEINREPGISSKELDVKIAQLNEAMTSRNQAVFFSKDAATGKDVVRVTNSSTGELIRQMPSVEALKAMQNIDQMLGLIFNRRT
mgnify:CR=1 FL=1|jgi:flagellar protein FlaG